MARDLSTIVAEMNRPREGVHFTVGYLSQEIRFSLEAMTAARQRLQTLLGTDYDTGGELDRAIAGATHTLACYDAAKEARK